MAFSKQFIKFSFLFGVLGTDELAVTGINYSGAGSYATAVGQLEEIQTADLLADATDLMADLMGTAEVQWAGYSKLTGLKVAAISTAGAYLAEPLVYEDESPGGGSTQQTPPQLSIVLSLLAATTLGTGNRGRMYLPHCHLGMPSNTPTSDEATAEAVADAGVTFINSLTTLINGATTVDLNPVIMSEAGGGSAKDVFAVAVGTVNDTQRRRRNALIEVYSTSTLA